MRESAALYGCGGKEEARALIGQGERKQQSDFKYKGSVRSFFVELLQ